MPLDNGVEIAEGGIFPWPVLNLLQMGDLGGDTSDVDGTAVVMSSNMMGCTGPKDGGGDGAGISFRISSQLLEPSDRVFRNVLPVTPRKKSNVPLRWCNFVYKTHIFFRPSKWQ